MLTSKIHEPSSQISTISSPASLTVLVQITARTKQIAFGIHLERLLKCQHQLPNLILVIYPVVLMYQKGWAMAQIIVKCSFHHLKVFRSRNKKLASPESVEPRNRLRVTADRKAADGGGVFSRTWGRQWVVRLSYIQSWFDISGHNQQLGHFARHTCTQLWAPRKRFSKDCTTNIYHCILNRLISSEAQYILIDIFSALITVKKLLSKLLQAPNNKVLILMKV